MELSAFIFFLFSFYATILSGPYLWNRYSQRLQIECAAWSCGLIVYCCLPSNSLRYFFLFLRHDFVRAISLEPLLAETPNWVCCLVLRSNCVLLLTIQFTSLFFNIFIFLFFSTTILSGPYLEPLLAETPNWVCCLVLRSNFALLPTIQFASLFFFRHDFVRRRVFHLRGIAPRSHTGRPRTCLVIQYYYYYETRKKWDYDIRMKDWQKKKGNGKWCQSHFFVKVHVFSHGKVRKRMVLISLCGFRKTCDTIPGFINTTCLFTNAVLL